MTIGTEALQILTSLAFVQAFLAAALIGFLCGTLGPYMVWRRVALMGDALAHANLAAIAMAVILDLPLLWVVIPFSVVMSQILAWLDEKGRLENDALLATFFAGFLAIGTLILTQTGHGTHELIEVLMGDLDLVQPSDVIWLAVLDVFVVIYFIKYRQDLVLTVLHPDLAKVQGVPVRRHHYVTMAIIALTVAIGLKIVGVILLTALLMIPALTARLFSPRLRGQLIWSTALGVILSVVGLTVALLKSWPAGPSIASIGFLFFLVVAGFKTLRIRKP